MAKSILEKLNNKLIPIHTENEKIKVCAFYESLGLESDWRFTYGYIGIINGDLTTITDSYGFVTITLEEAITIRDKFKAFPREMYVWDWDIDDAEKEMVYFIVEKSMEVDQPVLVVNGQTSFVYGNAMEIEEYEALTKKQNENAELIKQIEKTEKELAELKSKLK